MGKWKRMRIFLKYQHVNKGLFGSERLRPLLEKARELLPDPEIGQQQEQQQHQRGMGGMEL